MSMKCPKCKEWNELRRRTVDKFHRAGIKADAKGLDDDCVCGIMSLPRRFEDRELIIVK